MEGPPGPAWCNRWTDAVDGVLRRLLGAQGGVGVVALGGYARRELCPASDIDLVLLHDGWGHTDLEELVARLCYPLWDAGLTVGHAVRTPAEAAAAASERIDTATAVLDRRLVAGDAGLLDAFAARVRRWSKRYGRKAMVALGEETRSRHAQHGPVAGMLEPNLKEGPGGLRDIHTLRWGAGWVVGEPTLDGLVTAGYLSAADRAELAGANATILAARCALHQADSASRGRARDVLRMEWHDEVAGRLGYQAADGTRGDGEVFLHEVLLAMRTVAHLHDRTWPLLLADAGGRLRRRSQPAVQVTPGIRLHNGVITTDSPAGSPLPPWPVMAAAAAHGAPLGRAATLQVRRAIVAGAAAWTPQSRSALLETLHAPGAATALREADVVGLLAAALPSWERVRARAQRNPLHRFDLDTHGARAVRALHRLRTQDEDVAAVWEGIVDRDAVLLGTWLHDVGKAWPGDHAEAGAEVVQAWLTQMGFDPPRVRRVVQLVRWHLLLPDVATRRDLDDPAEITHVAETVQEVEILDGLYLLSLADSRATGTAAWSTWKDSLLARLHREVRTVLGAPAPAARHAAVDTAVPKEALTQLRRLAPARYFQIAGDDQVAAHAKLLPVSGIRASVRAGAVPQTAVLTVAARDRRGLLADCTGVLAGFGVEVYEARAFSGDGVALSWFITEPIADPDGVRDALEGLGGSTDVPALLRRRRWMARRPGAAAPVEITVRGQTVEVEAADSPALLYRLCAAMADLGHSVSALRVSTLGSAAFDVFDLTAPLTELDRHNLRAALLAAAASGAP